TTADLGAVASGLSFCASLILHELGHALVARRRGLPVAGIDLWALGGMTRAGEPESPGTELRVAIAGPLVTLAVIVVCTVAGQLATDSSHFLEAALATARLPASPALLWRSRLAPRGGRRAPSGAGLDRRLHGRRPARDRQQPFLRSRARHRRRARVPGAGVAELGGDDQRARARVQPVSRLSPRRGQDRARRDLVAHG